MDLEALKEQYKKHKLIFRLLFMMLLGLLPGLFIYLDQGSAVEADREAAVQEMDTAKDKFEKSKKRREEMPKLEEQLAFTEEQLEKAKAKVPDNIQISEILQKIATIAKELDVQLREFDPDAEIAGEEALRFIKLPIKLKVSGTYVQIVSFFDRIVHLEKIILVQDIHLEGSHAEGAKSPVSPIATPVGTPPPTLIQKANAERGNIKVDAEATIAVYRAAGANEAMPVAAAAGPARPGDPKAKLPGDAAAKLPGGTTPPAAGNAAQVPVTANDGADKE